MKLQHLMEMPSSASRILKYVQSGIPFFAISAMHKTMSDPDSEGHSLDNLKADRRLKDALRQEPSLGFFQQLGNYDNFPENSYIVSSDTLNVDELLQKGLDLGKQFGQDSILFFNGDDGNLYFQDGSHTSWNLSDFGAGGGDTDHSTFKGQKYTMTPPNPDDPNIAGKGKRNPRRDFENPIWKRDRANRIG